MIINPWLFYLINIAGSAKIIIGTLGGFLAFLSLIIFIVFSIENTKNEKQENLYKFSIKGFIIGLIMTIFIVFIPSEKACYQMLTASLVTKDNIEYVTETGKDLIDYIIESAETLFRNEKIKYAQEH